MPSSRFVTRHPPASSFIAFPRASLKAWMRGLSTFHAGLWFRVARYVFYYFQHYGTCALRMENLRDALPSSVRGSRIYASPQHEINPERSLWRREMKYEDARRIFDRSRTQPRAYVSRASARRADGDERLPRGWD